MEIPRANAYVRSRPWLLAVPAVLLVLALVGLELNTGGTYTGDTVGIVGGVGVADRCLDAGIVSRCGRNDSQVICSAPGRCGQLEHNTAVGPFPLLQYLPSWALKHLGATPKGMVRGLVAISGVATLLLLLVAVFTASRVGPREAALIAACLLAGPLIWYSHAGFGEALFAAALGLLALGALRGWHPALLGLLAFTAGIGKETSFPFIVAIVLVAWCTARRRPRRTEIAGLAIGLLLGLAATAAFNLFRFGSPFNLFYGASVLHTPFSDRPERFVALLFAPNGGIVWFWTAAMLVLALSLVVAVQRRGWSRAVWKEPAVLVLAVFLAIVAGLASWFSSFGAFAWGPRLLVPWIPPLIVILVFAYGRELTDLFARQRAMTAVCWALAAILSLASIGALFDSARRAHHLPFGGGVSELAYAASAPDAECPNIVFIQVDRAEYFRCARHEAWARSPVLVSALRDVWRREPGAALLYLLAIAGLAALIQASWLNQRPVTRSRKTRMQRPVSSTR